MLLNVAIQRVLNEMQEYECIQFDYLQVMNINCKKLLYVLTAILYSYMLILSLVKSETFQLQ